MRRALARRLAIAAAWMLLAAAIPGVSCRDSRRPGSGEGDGDGSSPAPPTKVIRTSTGAEMVLIPAGWFQMGSAAGRPDEGPVHKVWVDAFWMDRCEVTQEQYGKVVLGDGSHFKGPARPVEMISWPFAARYCNERSRAERLEPCYNEQTTRCNFQANGYRLPTEAQWEYACRAGTETEHFFGRDGRLLEAYAWYKANSANKTHPVAQRRPNPWGLYDMYGNVAEWCSDPYDKGYYRASPERNPPGPAEGDKYVLRGGSWTSTPEACRSASREADRPGFEDACYARDAIGFRCVRSASLADGGPRTRPADTPAAHTRTRGEPACRQAG